MVQYFFCFVCEQVLRPFLLRRLKKEVESQLPEKVGNNNFELEFFWCDCAVIAILQYPL